ncbi:type VI secretion system baseplate subunit TssG, partial [Escherichia coli]
DRSRERLCITQPADMAFASREIASIVQRPKQVLIQARHFGMFAPYGPLPIHVTEHARTEVIARRNQAFQQFVGIVSQRFAVLHYRAWAQLKAMIGHEHDDDK